MHLFREMLCHYCCPLVFSIRMSKALPRTNPVLTYLLDAYTWLNEALAVDKVQSQMRARLARASTVQALGALRAAANTALWSEEIHYPEDTSTAAKFERLLAEFQPDEVLQDTELAQLHELTLVEDLLRDPQVAQARDFPHPTRTDLIEFERTPLKCFSHDTTTCPPEYAGAVLGLVNGFVGSFFRKRCGCTLDRVEALFGTHLVSEDHHTATFGRQMLEDFRKQEQQLLANTAFMNHMASSRWKISPESFRLALLES